MVHQTAEGSQERGVKVVNLPAAQDESQLAVSEYSPKELQVRLNDMKQKVELLQSFFRNIMVEGQDYGKIPGTDKPTLLKPGSEKLCEFYGYSIGIDVEEQSNLESGYYRARVKVTLTSRRTGTVIAEGIGEANTMEGRYRWRWVPEDEVPPNLDRSALKARPSFRWVFESELPQGVNKASLQKETRTSKKGNPYTVYKIDSSLYRVPNDDPWSLWNTVLKMAKKRAVVDATLSATRSSGIFTQDVEDLQDWIGAGAVIDADFTEEEEEEKPGETGGKPQGQGQPASRGRTQPRGNGGATKPKEEDQKPPPQGNGGNGAAAIRAAQNLFFNLLQRFMETDLDLSIVKNRSHPDVADTAKAMWVAATNKESMKGAAVEDWEKAIAYVSAHLDEDEEEGGEEAE